MKFGLVCVIAALAVVAGCSGEIAGQPVPQGTGDQSPPTSAGPGSPDLADLNPCDLVTDAISTELGTGPAERARDLKYSTGCRWRVTKDTSATSYTLGVAIYPELGTDQINATGAKTPMSVNSRPAVQYLGAANSVCVISLEVTATSRVDVTANRAGSDGSEVCPQAKAAAELIEPELPPKG